MFYSQTKKKATQRKRALSKEREREKAVCFGSGRDAFRATKVCYIMSARIKKVSFFEKRCFSTVFVVSIAFFSRRVFSRVFVFSTNEKEKKKKLSVTKQQTDNNKERERETTKPFIVSAKKREKKR